MKEIISSLLAKELKLTEGEIEKLIEVPPNPELGDYSFPCFSLASKLKKNPAEIARDLSFKLKPGKEVEKIHSSGPYLNFFISKRYLAEKSLKIDENFGKSNQKSKIMIEFSQANTHKAFHVGHIRGTSLGESIARTLEFLGNKVIRANYQGDSGMHVAKWIWCYLNFHKKEKIRADEKWIASIYVDAVQRLAKDENLQEEVNEINRKLEEGSDKTLVALWKKTRQLSLDSLEVIYKDLGTKFKEYFFESQLEKAGKEAAHALLKKNIAIVSDGATILDLKPFNLGVWVLLRKDGTVLYSAKDIALAEEKFSRFKLDKSVYIVGAAQKLHFEQLIKTLELMKNESRKDIQIIHMQEVRLPSGKMSSRTGENILYSEFKQEITDYTKKEIKKRFPRISKSELEKRALSISIAAIKYSMLKQDANSTIVFNKEEALNFEGDSGPYLQYSYARASSIIKKAGKTRKNAEIPELSKSEFELIKKILGFPEIVQHAAKSLSPNEIANYSFSLAQRFNEFYHSSKVIGSDEESFKLELVESFRKVMKSSLSLLGIEVLEEM